MTKKLPQKIAIVFGGPSTEHEVSIVSAQNIFRAMDSSLFDKVLIGISKSGTWFQLNEPEVFFQLKTIDDKKPHPSFTPVTFIKAPQGAEILNLTTYTKTSIDGVFPVLHGSYGEDGCIQGFFELLQIPYVGCGVLSSSVGMDKEIMKRLLNEAQIPNSPYLVLSPEKKLTFSQVAEQLGLPFFIKPARTGSSVGVHKIKSEKDFTEGLKDAFKYDSKVLAEKFIQGREIECSVLGPNAFPKASLPGEVIPQHEFYSYDAKYIDADGARLVIPAALSENVRQNIQRMAQKTYTTLECDGLTRVDFFLTPDEKIYVNEINTLPGFTQISMYPKMWESSGVAYKDLITQLIRLAFERFEKQSHLIRTL